jgi:hypothetical protein
MNCNIERARQLRDTSFPTASAAVNQLVDLGVVQGMTRQKEEPQLQPSGLCRAVNKAVTQNTGCG